MAQITLRGKMWYSDLRMNGKRIVRALSRYKPEAQKKLNQMLEVRQANKRGDIVRDMSWEYFRHAYLEASKIDKKHNTFLADRRAFDVIDAVSHLTQIEQMTPERLANIRITLMGSKQYTPCVIAVAVRRMMTAMRWAEDRKYIPMQNWRIVQKKNKEPKGRVDFYERTRYLNLLSRLEGEWLTSALLMGRAGLRVGEALHLEWSDIEFDNQRIIFRSKPNLGWQIKKDDELKKIRVIPLFWPDLRQHLESIRRPSGFVLEGQGVRREDVYGKRFKKALVATGIKTFSGRLGFPYLLRHTFGSHLAQIGVSLTKIAAWMGHESERMTECYRHLCPADLSSDINVVQRLHAGFVPENENGIEKLASVLLPVSNSVEPFTTILGSLDPENGDDNLPSKTT